MTVLVVHRKERNAVLMGETGEDLFLNVQCSWFSIHIATLKIKEFMLYYKMSAVIKLLKGPQSATPLFLFLYESFGIKIILC